MWTPEDKKAYEERLKNEVCFLEYSVTQDCFHVDTLDRILRFNLSNCQVGYSASDTKHHKLIDFVIIYGPSSYDDCLQAIRHFLPIIKNKDLTTGK